MDIFPKL